MYDKGPGMSLPKFARNFNYNETLTINITDN